MAMMPSDRGWLKALSGVFLTTPLAVAKKTNRSSKLRMASTALCVSFCCMCSRLAMARPRLAR